MESGDYYRNVYSKFIHDLEEFKLRLANTWANVKKVSLTRLSNSGGEGCRPASVLKDENSSICFMLSYIITVINC